MAFCAKCGAQMEDGTKFCPVCGAPAQEQAYTYQQESAPQNGFEAKVAEINNTVDATGDFAPEDIEQNKVMGILAYLSWLVLVPLFAAKTSPYARFHTNQGLVLAITEIIWIIIQTVVTSILYAISWRLSFIGTILGLVNIVFLVFAIIGIMNAINGKAKELPLIGGFRIIK